MVSQQQCLAQVSQDTLSEASRVSENVRGCHEDLFIVPQNLYSMHCLPALWDLET